jgi:hypothetical protein
MYEHNNAYPILNQDDLLPREQIRLVSEDKLGPFMKAELTNLKRGIVYKGVLSDTPENRKNLAFKTTYFQMVAYKEGWVFNPEQYQVCFVNPAYITGEQRIYQFQKGAETPFGELSAENRAGFDIDGYLAKRMDNKEADGLTAKIIQMFPDRN